MTVAKPRTDLIRYGFTLFELVIALAIFTIISGAVYGTLRNGVAAQRTGERNAEILQIARTVLARIVSDVRSAYTSEEGVFRGEMVGEDEVGTDVDLDTLRFVATHTPKVDATGEMDLANIEYYIDDDEDTDERGLMCRQSPVVDLVEQQENTLEIAAEIRSLNLRYYDGTDWQDTWDSSGDGVLPLSVEISIGIDPRALELDYHERGEITYLERFMTVVRIPMGGQRSDESMEEAPADG